MNKRQQLIRIIKDLAIGRITTEEFELRFNQCDTQKEYRAIYDELWLLYGDYEGKLIGEAQLSRESKQYIARVILFLQTDLTYRWPNIQGYVLSKWQMFIFYSLFIASIWSFIRSHSIGSLIMIVLMGGLIIFGHYIAKKVRDEDKLFKQIGADLVCWPFFTVAEYQQALAYPWYFTGKKRKL